MTTNPERADGVGKPEVPVKASTELLDYLAKEGLKNILLTISQLRIIAAEHPTEYLNLPSQAFSLQQMAAYIAHGLNQAGYDETDVIKPSISKYSSQPHDPLKPRSNT